MTLEGASGMGYATVQSRGSSVNGPNSIETCLASDSGRLGMLPAQQTQALRCMGSSAQLNRSSQA